MVNKLIVKGANEHNLKNVDVELPRDKFIVFTGLSGSGKSSLAFDTIYAEGQRRYVESLSSYARQFLGQMEKPDVEYIEGLSPAISIDQKTTNRNPRSTVGTVTEIYDYYRLLFANIGIPHCPKCGKRIEAQSIDQMVESVLNNEEGTKIQILAPIARGKKGQFKKQLEQIRKDGYVRVRIDKEIYDIEEVPELTKTKKHDIEVIIDRLKIRDNIRRRLSDSIETALKLAEGLVLVLIGEDKENLFSQHFACTDCGISVEAIAPRMFSFNSPFGMCSKCNGLGHHKKIDINKIIPDMTKSISEGAIDPFSNSGEETYYYQMFEAMAKRHKFDIKKPIGDAPEIFMEELLYGTGEEKIKFNFKSHFSGDREYFAPFEGIVNNLERRFKETNSDYMIDKIGTYMEEVKCDHCKGKRLKPESLAVTINKINIIELTELSVKESIEFFNEIDLTDREKMIAEQILKEIKARLGFLGDVGLGYLSLSRSAGTLSGGESQRIRLATQIGSSLVGVLYVLDEPSIGLHQKDNEKLIRTLRNLTEIGNTLIVVEHDEDTIRQADHIVDIGPGAGIHGGEVVCQGEYKDIINCKKSITGKYLIGDLKIDIPKNRRKFNGKNIEIKRASENNLKNIDVKLPLGIMTCITGVSGSGKSSLINEILYKQVAKTLHRSKVKPGKHKEIKGIENIDKVIDIDQSPIGRTPRSNPATYTGVFDKIRDVFATTQEAKMRGYKKGRFSFNVKGGRCEACRGDGVNKIEMHFLPDVYVPCEVCKGKRYNRETLEVKYKGKNISDVLEMSVEEAVLFFENIPMIHKKLEVLNDVGLGYIKLGQPSTQLSGGEAQRIKLAAELSKRNTGKTLYILDEPTTGLHMADVHKLIDVLSKLVDAGNTVVVIEHNLDVIKVSDYIIDLGPEGGSGGGEIVAFGTPEEIVKCSKSYTGQFLKNIL